MRYEDLIIAVAYFSIPIQIVISISFYPRLASMPLRVTILLILFALFIFFCGVGHVIRCLGRTDEVLFYWINWLTALISAATSIYLLPIVPTLLGHLDNNIDDIIRLKDKAERSNRQMLTFMSFLCHEIRNPLFAVTSSVEFLNDEKLSCQQQVNVSAIDQSAKLMLRLVNDVLDINRLENGGMHIENREFDFHELLRHLQETASTNVAQRHKGSVVFHSEIGNDVPRIVLGDSARLLQIVYNLLTNAIKFTEQGSIELKVTVCHGRKGEKVNHPSKPSVRGGDLQLVNIGEDGTRTCCADPGTVEEGTETGRTEPVQEELSLLEAAAAPVKSCESHSTCVRIEVADTGSGIASNRLDDIFKPFTQAKLSDYREYGGTGLGLSIVSQLLKIMGGTINAESSPGEGSVFTVILPMEEVVGPGGAEPVEFRDSYSRWPPRTMTSLDVLAAVEPEVVEPEEEVKESPLLPIDYGKTKTVICDVENKKFDLPPNDYVVLVTDDNAINVKIICRMLDRFHVEYRTATNGKEACEAVEQSRNLTGNPGDHRFALALMDLCMPVMGGCEAIQKIRGRNVTIPILALTANAMEESKAEAEAAGATEFVTKPILRDDLFRKLQVYFEK